MEINSLGDKLRALRIAHSYKQIDIAAVIGVVRQTYSHYERGTRTPNVDTLYRLAAFYNISVNDLLKYTTQLDPELYFDTPMPQDSDTSDNDEFIKFLNVPFNKKRFRFFSNTERRLLFYFEQLSTIEQWELVEISKLKTTKEDYKSKK